MINPLFVKLFGNMVENKINKWVEEKEKCVKVQANFRPKHSTIDHGITLRHIVEKEREEREEVFVVLLTSRRLLTQSLG